MITFTLEGPPVGKERARRGRSGHWYTPAKTVAFEARVRAAFHQAQQASGQTCLGCSLKLRVFVKGRRHPDLDNIWKGVADGLQGIAYRNDNGLLYAEVTMILQATRPRIEVEVQ